MSAITNSSRPYLWELEYRAHKIVERIAREADGHELATVGDAIRTGVNTVHLYDPTSKEFLGYGYLEKDGKPRLGYQAPITLDTPITDVEVDTDDAGYTIITANVLNGERGVGRHPASGITPASLPLTLP